MNFKFLETITCYCLCLGSKIRKAIAIPFLRTPMSCWRLAGKVTLSLCHRAMFFFLFQGIFQVIQVYENICLWDPGCLFSLSQIRHFGRHFYKTPRYKHPWQWLVSSEALTLNKTFFFHQKILRNCSSFILFMSKTKALPLWYSSCVTNITSNQQRGLGI